MIRRVYFGFKCDKRIQEDIYYKLKGENIDFLRSILPKKTTIS